MHTFDGMNLADDELKSLLVKNRSRYGGFNKEIKSDFRISNPETFQHKKLITNIQENTNFTAKSTIKEISSNVVSLFSCSKFQKWIYHIFWKISSQIIFK